MTTLRDDLRSFRRTWVHHTGMQLATLTVLSATLSVVVFVLSLSMNLGRILSSWGNSVQLTAYLSDDASDARAANLRKEISAFPEVSQVAYVPREAATENFKVQLATYAPDLLTDTDFSNPFPASLKVSLKKGISSEQDVTVLERLAAQVGQLSGIEDVTFGSSWVRNYSNFVSAINAGGGTMIAILLLGGVFVVGNSIRASISARREEIEILELVGATSSMIRRPYVMEGLIMGFLSALFALIVNFGMHIWHKSLLAESLAFARLLPNYSFLDIAIVILVVIGGAGLGAFGAWFTVRNINDGWSARSKGQEA